MIEKSNSAFLLSRKPMARQEIIFKPRLAFHANSLSSGQKPKIKYDSNLVPETPRSAVLAEHVNLLLVVLAVAHSVGESIYVHLTRFVTAIKFSLMLLLFYYILINV